VRVLIVDNYDSFTFNLHQYVGALGASSQVEKNDALTLAELEALAPDRIILSPGPGRPEREADFGICGDVITALSDRIPVLGVCLGHQGIVHRFGGRVIRAPRVMHGKTSLIRHTGVGLFTGLEPQLEVMRYHSLVAERASMPDTLQITAETADEERLVMAVQHVRRPLYGVQFHLESVGTACGMALLERFLRQ
jgi:anthranilate synthase/aminodeoxychorismate synthase-like glutamine amidotransferase